MFRGFELSQLRFILVLVVLLFGALILHQQQSSGLRVAAQLDGARKAHEPGILVRDEQQAETPRPTASSPDLAPAPADADPTPPPTSSPTPPQPPPGITENGLILINRAAPETLELLPGIGPKRAAAIITARNRRGGFHRVEELQDVHGIGEKTLAKLRPHVYVEGAFEGQTAEGNVARASSAPRSISINSAGKEQLQELPGIGPVLAGRIIVERMRKGPFGKVRDLQRVKGIGPKTAAKMAPYISFQ